MGSTGPTAASQASTARDHPDHLGPGDRQIQDTALVRGKNPDIAARRAVWRPLPPGPRAGRRDGVFAAGYAWFAAGSHQPLVLLAAFVLAGLGIGCGETAESAAVASLAPG
jgi:hypothetical protein